MARRRRLRRGGAGDRQPSKGGQPNRKPRDLPVLVDRVAHRPSEGGQPNRKPRDLPVSCLRRPSKALGGPRRPRARRRAGVPVTGHPGDRRTGGVHPRSRSPGRGAVPTPPRSVHAGQAGGRVLRLRCPAGNARRITPQRTERGVPPDAPGSGREAEHRAGSRRLGPPGAGGAVRVGPRAATALAAKGRTPPGGRWVMASVARAGAMTSSRWRHLRSLTTLCAKRCDAAGRVSGPRCRPGARASRRPPAQRRGRPLRNPASSRVRRSSPGSTSGGGPTAMISSSGRPRRSRDATPADGRPARLQPPSTRSSRSMPQSSSSSLMVSGGASRMVCR
jgi:hypothetical protein